MMNDNQKKIFAIILAVLAIFLLLFLIFRTDKDFTEHREMLQRASDEYIENTGCYPSIREVSFGNPSPIDFQKLYHKLDDDFEINKNLHYWISSDGKVWISKTDVPEMDLENDLLTYDRQGRLTYHLYYHENNELTKEETREKEIDISEINYAISEHHGRGLETPPANQNYEGYEKHKPLVKIKDLDDSKNLLAMIEEEKIDRGPVGNMLAAIGDFFRRRPEWYGEYGFDIYGEGIVEGNYDETVGDMGAVMVKTQDDRESYWIDLEDPINVGVCYGVDWEVVDVEPVDPDDDPIDPVYPEPTHDTRRVTVKGGPKRNPEDFEDVISFETKDGFSGLLYRYEDPFMEEDEKEEKEVVEYKVRKDDEFPETIKYNKDEFTGTLTLRTVGDGLKKVTETRTAGRPGDLPEKLEYDEEDYYGTLEPVGDYETIRTGGGTTTRRRDIEKELIKTDLDDFEDEIEYSEGGYSGTLTVEDGYEKIEGEKEHKETVEREAPDEFPEYITKEIDGETVRLYPEDSYRRIEDEEDSMEVTETIERKSLSKFPDYITYEKDGYEGRLEKPDEYTKIEGESKEETKTLTRSTPNFPDYITYEKDGYEGRLDKDGGYRALDDGTFEQSYSGLVEKEGDSIYEQSYSGTVEKEGDSTYEQSYSGTVEKQISEEETKYHQDYSGTVEKDSLFEQDYKGEVLKPDTFKMVYSGKVVKEAKDYFEKDYYSEATEDKFKRTYSGEITRRVSRTRRTRYEQTYEGIIYTSDGDHYIGIYSGTVVSEGLYYQLYQGILRRPRN